MDAESKIKRINSIIKNIDKIEQRKGKANYLLAYSIIKEIVQQ